MVSISCLMRYCWFTVGSEGFVLAVSCGLVGAVVFDEGVELSVVGVVGLTGTVVLAIGGLLVVSLLVELFPLVALVPCWYSSSVLITSTTTT